MKTIKKNKALKLLPSNTKGNKMTKDCNKITQDCNKIAETINTAEAMRHLLSHTLDTMDDIERLFNAMPIIKPIRQVKK